MKPFDPLVLRAKVAVFIELWQKTVEIRRRDALLAEQELAAVERESEVRYRSLADAVPQIVWTADADGVIAYRNERWYELTGLARGRERSPGRTSSTPTMRPRCRASLGRSAPDSNDRWRSSTGSASPTARTAGILGRALPRRGHVRLGRHLDRHRGPQARRGAAGVPRRGRLGARQLARLRADARGRRAARRAAGRRLVRGRHLRRRTARSGSRSSTPTRSSSHSPASCEEPMLSAVAVATRSDRARARDGDRRARARILPLQRATSSRSRARSRRSRT